MSKAKARREKPTPEQKKAKREAFVRFCKVNKKKLLIAGAALAVLLFVLIVFKPFTPRYVLGNKLLDEAAKLSLGVDKLTEEDLPRITELIVVGDRPIDPASGDIWENWSNDLYDHRYGVNGESVERGTIEDVSGLAACVNLEKLTLCFQNIHDPSAIYGLPKLTELHLAGNEVWVHDGAAQMTRLEVLDLRGCPFATFAPITQLVNLRELDLSYSSIEDINGIQQLTKLTRVGLAFCYRLSDFSPLGECAFPEAENGITLDLSCYPEPNYAPLANIKLFYDLDVDGIAAHCIVPYLEGAEMTTLSLSGCDLMDFEGLAKIKGLKHLTVGGNYLDNLNGIEGLTELVTLDLRDNDTLFDLTPLLGLKTLERVNLSPDMYPAYESIAEQASFAITGLD